MLKNRYLILHYAAMVESTPGPVTTISMLTPLAVFLAIFAMVSIALIVLVIVLVLKLRKTREELARWSDSIYSQLERTPPRVNSEAPAMVNTDR